MINEKISDIFEEMSIFLDMTNVPFKPRAYEKAAAEIRVLAEDVGEIYAKGGLKTLENIPSIGKGMAEKIEEYIKIGSIREYERLKKKYPIHVKELRAIEGVGPKMIKTLYRRLNVKNLSDLEKAAQGKRIRAIPHFGAKTEKHILKGISFLRQSGNRRILGSIFPVALFIEEQLQKVNGVKHAIVAGSIRRRQETIGDIDLLVTTSKPDIAIKFFVSMPEVIAVHSRGPSRASVRLNNGMDADIRVVPDSSFGAALLYFTGDKSHNIALRERALKQGMKLSEYGLFKGKNIIASATERDVYRALGLDYIEPELRTCNGEIGLAEKHALPKSIPYGSIRGDLQVQSEWTDGKNSIRELMNAALDLGYEYIAITDHTKNLAITGGLDEKKLAAQGREIDRLNQECRRKNKKIKILKGAEVNILKDGTLDIGNDALSKLDIVGIAIHSHFKMQRHEMTHRIITAMKNPLIHILFHPTGRLINQRAAYDVDMEQVMKAAKAYRVALEINAYPERSDIRDDYVRLAVRHGIKMVINTDAHAREHLQYMHLGVAIARRGWAEKKDILNTRSLDKLLAFFEAKK